MITLQGKPIASGCYVDGNKGHYLCAATLSLAVHTLPKHAKAPTWRRMAQRYELAHAPFGDDYEDHEAMAETFEVCFDMADEAVDALNEATVGGQTSPGRSRTKTPPPRSPRSRR